ncbi:GntP family permease [Corynebacterium pygosceleis]|uniref:GntP family permease n=1 Tax=Corynebacterium pygosceleis TaxID=2800406 RepID=A0A9Q4GKK7_9CORY|nr:GntP family permease [Corynebacterium pygosceleis]MCK7638548.1 GntP family permease [Corynebacterium pygosceleis]MCK7676326.1 GntP family permease [Corynebacterium pygosceleis]MCL0121515.1 GntP family permease [Corynebacterium pygosceleis]MCX7469309.1 GntP family permease [Corynebacterium pygosceleis]
METWQQTMGTGPLLGIALAAVLMILYLVIRLRMHAFLVLVLVSAVTALAAGLPVAAVLPTMTEGFGGTLAGVALLVGLGAMLGRLVEISGGARSLAETLTRAFGDDRAPLALGIASLIMGFPIFFDAGLIVMLPVVFAVARRLGEPVLRYGIPAAGAFSVMHVFLPPHPGPIAAAELYGADLGLVLLLGLITVFPVWYLSGYRWGLHCGRRFPLAVPDLLSGGPESRESDLPARPAGTGTVLAVLALPLILIFGNTGLHMAGTEGWVDPESAWVQAVRFLGSTPVALLVTTLVAALVLGVMRGMDKGAVERAFDGALAPVATVILVTGAGGMFGGVLRATGIGDALAGTLGDLGVPLILAVFLTAVALRVAQGSATVALTTAAALMAPAVAAAGLSEVQLAAVVLATAAGSVAASHVNDSGFWLVGRLMGMDPATTLRTWTVNQTLIAVIGFASAVLVYLVGGQLA